jgi:RecJ-like exonuclease
MLKKGLAEVCAFIRERDGFTVVGHHDADGLAASAIVALALKRLGKRFAIHSTKQLDRDRIGKIAELGDRFIFVDLGSGQAALLGGALAGREFCIIDHHAPSAAIPEPQFNPHLFGADGSMELSAAGAAYFVAKALDARNVSLAPIAIVGAVGDMQDSGGSLVGLNREILKDGESCGEIEVKNDIRLFGRHSRPLTQFLSYCSEPFLPGLTANEEACRQFLHSLGIKLFTDRWLFYADLDDGQKKRLISGLYVYGKQHNVPEYILRTLVGEVYELKREPERTELRDAKEFATMLNACGRHDKPDIGIEVCMGDRGDAFARARTLLQHHRKMLRDGVEWSQKRGAVELKNVYVLDGEKEIKDTLIGVIAGMLYGAQVIRHDKPIVALALDDEGMLKASGRATAALVRQGVNLGAAMREAAAAVGGEGGGHNIAAGARMPPERKKAFIEAVNDVIGKQIRKP